jgi:hypothetical protein
MMVLSQTVGSVHTCIFNFYRSLERKRNRNGMDRKEYLCDIIWENLTVTFVSCTKISY